MACLVAAIVAFALSQTCYALEETANVMVDGEYVEFTDQQPVIIDGRTLVPIRAVMEKMGKTVPWDEATQTTTVSDDEISISLTIGDNIMRQVVVDSGTGEVFEFDRDARRGAADNRRENAFADPRGRRGLRHGCDLGRGYEHGYDYNLAAALLTRR